MHTKRQKTHKSWPIPRKGTKYVVNASHEKDNGIPVLIVLRDMLKIAKNRKEVKKILKQKTVKLNNKTVNKDNLTVLPLDILTVGNKKYELTFLQKGKFNIKETDRTETILKITGRKMLKNKKIQLNLLYGKNILCEEKVKVGSSAVIKDKKIIKTIPLEIGKTAKIIFGKYKGKEGKIKKIENQITTIATDKEEINAPTKSIMAIK